LTFFNADYFKARALAAASAAGPSLRWFAIDVNGLYALGSLRDALEERGITLVLAGRMTEILYWFDELDLPRERYEGRVFPTLRQALKAYQRQLGPIAS
jgi:hypothetical protein